MRTILFIGGEPGLGGRPQVSRLTARPARAVALAAFVVFASAVPALAQPHITWVAPSTGAVVSADRPALLSAARTMVAEVAAQDNSGPSSAADTADKGPSRRKHLTLGLIGAGTAVAGLFVYRGGNDTPHLPGISNGRQTTGFVMVGAGAAIAIPSLIKAFK